MGNYIGWGCGTGGRGLGWGLGLFDGLLDGGGVAAGDGDGLVAVLDDKPHRA